MLGCKEGVVIGNDDITEEGELERFTVGERVGGFVGEDDGSADAVSVGEGEGIWDGEAVCTLLTVGTDEHVFGQIDNVFFIRTIFSKNLPPVVCFRKKSSCSKSNNDRNCSSSNVNRSGSTAFGLLGLIFAYVNDASKRSSNIVENAEHFMII